MADKRIDNVLMRFHATPDMLELKFRRREARLFLGLNFPYSLSNGAGREINRQQAEVIKSQFPANITIEELGEKA